MGKHNLYSLCC